VNRERIDILYYIIRACRQRHRCRYIYIIQHCENAATGKTRPNLTILFVLFYKIFFTIFVYKYIIYIRVVYFRVLYIAI